MLSGLTLEVAPGEHVLWMAIRRRRARCSACSPGSGPGARPVDLPADADMIAVGPRPFLPEVRCAARIAFSDGTTRSTDAALATALESVGLGHLADRLDEAADWGRNLSAAELQCLSFARLFLLRPDWIVLGDATDALDPLSADLMLRLLVERLPGPA